MKIDYKNRKIDFDSPMEEELYNKHMAEYGPGGKGSHPDNCEYCKKMGWPTWPGTTFEEECEKRYPSQPKK